MLGHNQKGRVCTVGIDSNFPKYLAENLKRVTFYSVACPVSMMGGTGAAGSPNGRAGVCSIDMFSTYLRSPVGAAGGSQISWKDWSSQAPPPPPCGYPTDFIHYCNMARPLQNIKIKQYFKAEILRLFVPEYCKLITGTQSISKSYHNDKSNLSWDQWATSVFLYTAWAKRTFTLATVEKIWKHLDFSRHF